MQHTTETPKQYQCRHIFTDGRRCASPCLRQEEFCYYHHTTRKPIASPRQRRSRRSTFHLPLPEDRSAIQASIGEVLQRIAANDIDPRRAGLLLYGLQIAGLNLPKTQPAAKTAAGPQTANQTAASQIVEEIIIDPTLGVLAPRAEVSANTKRKSPVHELLERMMQSDEAETVAQESTTIPTLQATADGSVPHAKVSDARCLTSPTFFRPNVNFYAFPRINSPVASYRSGHRLGASAISPDRSPIRARIHYTTREIYENGKSSTCPCALRRLCRPLDAGQRSQSY